MAFYTSRPVEITATYCDTGKPASNVAVDVECWGMLVLNVPKKVGGVTDNQGKLTLRMADFEKGSMLLTAGINEYPLPPELVRNGGPLTHGWQLSMYASIPASMEIRLAPQPTLLERVFAPCMWTRDRQSDQVRP
jgi:hypothetical protein